MREVSVTQLADAHRAGEPVVDVREPWEYARAHVPGAQLLPLCELAARVREVPPGQVVYVICASGNRSKDGARVLESAGRTAVSVAGGTSRWISAGYPVENGRI